METKKNEAQNKVQEVQEYDVLVLGTEVSPKYPERVSFLVSEDLPQYNENGELITRNDFTLHEYNSHIQLRKLCRRYAKMMAYNDARPLDAGVLGATVAGAKMHIKRTLKHENEPREEINGKSAGVYEHDTFVTEILSVELEDAFNTDNEVKMLILEKKQQNNLFNF